MTSRPLNWEAIQTVVEVARSGTVRGAAKALAIHHTTIIRRIEQLEQAVGTRLFDRNPEGYSLTGEGEALAQVAERFSADLIETRHLITGNDMGLAGRLTVTIAEPLFIELFVPRLREFNDLYPDLIVEYDTGFGLLDMTRHAADVAIRMDNNPPDTLIGKRLFAYHQTAYATPAYLVEHKPQVSHTTARWLGWGSGDSAADWPRETEFPRLEPWGAFPTPMAQQAAAANGLGLAILPCLFGDADPRLVRAGKRPPVKSRDIWLLTHADLRNTARVRAFMDFAETVLRDAKDRIVGRLPDSV